MDVCVLNPFLKTMCWVCKDDYSTDLYPEEVSKKSFKGIIKTLWVKILQNGVFEMIKFFI